MAGQNEACAVIEGVLDAGEGCFDSFVAGNFFSAGCERDVKIHPHEDALPLQVEVANRQCAHLKMIAN